MKVITRRLLMVMAGVSAVSSMVAADQPSINSKGGASGAVFVMTNDAANNEVVSYERTPDGQLFVGGRFDTGGRGSGGAIDPLQSQGSLVLSENHLLLFAANAGSGTVSVFRVKDATLRLLDQTPSGGSEPIAVAKHGSLVYVLNGAAAGAVVGFRWDDKQLRQIPNAISFLSGTSAGGASLTISPDGKVLVVTERLTNNIDTFKINVDGTLTAIVPNTSTAPGVFSAEFSPEGTVIVSETGPANGTNASAISSYKVLANGSLSAVTQSLPTLGAANCWNAITPNGKYVYVSNAGSDNIAGFAIGSNGALTPIGSTVLGLNPAGSTNLDIAISPDGAYLYTLNSGGGTIGIFSIQKGGGLTHLGQVGGLPKAAGLNGIAVF